MTLQNFTELPAPSPCINICNMDTATGWCSGCFRTIDEIMAWRDTSNSEKHAVLTVLPAREIQYWEHL
jgi:predicted Fe-S protein YdhL (DUF1289 family)